MIKRTSRILIFILSVLISVSMIAAQSGRKVDAPPTENEVRTIQKDADFSESKPTKLPEVYVTRKMRLEMEKRKKEDAEKSKVIENKSKTTQNVGASEDEISVETNLVTIPVSVFDRNGLYIPNLERIILKFSRTAKNRKSRISERRTNLLP